MYEQMTHFFAYGQPTATMWIVGLEEHCEADDLARRIALRTGNPTEYLDLESFHVDLMQQMPAIDDVSVWNIASQIYAGVHGRPTELGRLPPVESDLLLTEILPLPRAQNHHWPALYEELFPTAADYVENALPLMSARLVAKVEEHSPEVVILHGKGSHDRWVNAHPQLGAGWTTLRYGDRRNETLKWRLQGPTLWLRTNNLVNNGHITFQPPQIAAVVELIRQRRLIRR